MGKITFNTLYENQQSASVYPEGTLQELSGRFSDLAHAFLKFIRPLGRLNESHGIELHETARGDGDYEKLKDALNMLNASIDAFSRNFRILGDNPQNFVNQTIKWLRNLIEYHETSLKSAEPYIRLTLLNRLITSLEK